MINRPAFNKFYNDRPFRVLKSVETSDHVVIVGCLAGSANFVFGRHEKRNGQLEGFYTFLSVNCRPPF